MTDFAAIDGDEFAADGANGEAFVAGVLFLGLGFGARL